MLTLLSPAKMMDLSPSPIDDHSLPRMLTETWHLIKVLKTYDKSGIMDLMKVSEPLASETLARFKNFKRTHHAALGKQAHLTFSGGVYQGLDAPSFGLRNHQYAQENLRILSGLYGILKPLDIIQPYRLEIGTRLKTDSGTNLYKYWGDKITKMINKDLKANDHKKLVNLASNEYFKAINAKLLQAEVLNVQFKEHRDGVIKFISFDAKKARGLLAQYIIKNELKSFEEIRKFNMEGYQFQVNTSTRNDYLFVR